MAGIANSRRIRIAVFAYDLGMAALAVFIALFFRLGPGFGELDNESLLAGAVLPFGAATAVSLIVLRTYCTSWRHASTADLINIVQAATLAVLIYLPLSFVSTRLTLIPRSFVLLSWLVLIVLMAGSRVGYRLFRERRLFFTRRAMAADQVPVLVVGGGVNAEIFLRQHDAGSSYYPVGILDDAAQGGLLRGVPVVGKIDDVAEVVEAFRDAGDRPRKLVVVDRDLPPKTLDFLLDVANRLGIAVARAADPKQLQPGLHDEEDLQPISVEDLLGRPQVVLNPAPLRALIAGRRVLVTGAGGSIGSELVRQVCATEPAAICLVEASELNLYTIDAEVGVRWPDVRRLARLTDVRNRLAIDYAFEQFRPEIVFHAAALKHVPLVEGNPTEGIWTNVIGTRNVSEAAVQVGASEVVVISTDKAVNPTNVMGASKRCAESYCQALAREGAARANGTRFVVVRFGNVLGSTGSVVPLFEQQLKRGGPLTVTHPDMERFFMTVREAVQLVLHASALGSADADLQGRVFVLDMGQPVKIVELARQMIKLAGKRPGHDIAIEFTGLRPGEKLYEELFHTGEHIEATSLPRVNVASPRASDLAWARGALSELEHVCAAGREKEALRILQAMVPEFVLQAPLGDTAYQPGTTGESRRLAMQSSR